MILGLLLLAMASHVPAQLSAPSLSPAVAGRAEQAIRCAEKHGMTPRRLLVADMSMRSTQKRLWEFDITNPMHPKLLLNDLVAHGAGSDPKNTGTPTKFSNATNSHSTSLGVYAVAEAYVGKHGLAYRLDGLMAGFNNNARERDVVLHKSDYVREGNVGRSYGCPAVSPAVMTALDKEGLKNTVLWIDGQDAALEQALASCAGDAPSTQSIASFVSI